MANDQYRCPVGEEGRKIIDSMNKHHVPLTDWALSELPDVEPGWILDIGCGGGMLIGKLARMFPTALIDAIDISDEAIHTSTENNREYVNSGRVHILKASVSDLPYDSGTFDLITAVETYFFWPYQELDIFAAADRLAPGGLLMIASEAYPDPDFDDVNRRHSEEYGMKLLSNERMIDIMSDASMDVTMKTVKENNWVVFIGRKK